MTVFVADDPLNNSYVVALIEAYKRAGIKVICGVRNFFLTNLIPEVMHIQWPEKIYNINPFAGLPESEQLSIIEERLKWFKSNNTILVHTIHNVEPHRLSKPEFERKVFKLIISYSDILVHHCKRSIEILKSVYPESEFKINIENHHPDYLLEFEKISKTAARKKLGIRNDVFVILNFGSQQKYKGEELIESVFKKIPIKEKFLLTAGGYIFDGYSGFTRLRLKLRNKLREKINFSNRKYCYQNIKPKELPYYLSSADILFLGHESGLNSGVLPLAATYGKPVVFPDIGCFKSQMENWIYESYNRGNTTDALNVMMRIYKRIKTHDTDEFDNSKWLMTNSWGKHIQKILTAVEEIKSTIVSTAIK